MTYKSLFRRTFAVCSIGALIGSVQAQASWAGAIKPFLRGGALTLGEAVGAAAASSSKVVGRIIAASSVRGGVELTDAAQIKTNFETQMTNFAINSEGISWTRSDLEDLLKQVVADDTMCGRAQCQRVLGFSSEDVGGVIDGVTARLENRLNAKQKLIDSLSDQLKVLAPSSDDHMRIVSRVSDLQVQKSDISKAVAKLNNSLIDDSRWITELLNCRY